jgi:hypothetical protein
MSLHKIFPSESNQTLHIHNKHFFFRSSSRTKQLEAFIMDAFSKRFMLERIRESQVTFGTLGSTLFSY